MYRECKTSAPGDNTGTNPLHVLSGVAVSPVRTPSASVVPAGTSAVQLMLSQLTPLEASNTRERNAPELAYGVVRTQSTTMSPLKTLKSLAAMGRICPLIAAAWVAIGTPSMK
jgi:hypothetical protein